MTAIIVIIIGKIEIKMKQCKRYGSKDLLLGFHNRKNNDVAVNIELIWLIQELKAQDNFIKQFANVIEHEIVHRTIYELGFHSDTKDYGEELTIRKLLNWGLDGMYLYEDENEQ